MESLLQRLADAERQWSEAQAIANFSGTMNEFGRMMMNEESLERQLAEARGLLASIRRLQLENKSLRAARDRLDRVMRDWYDTGKISPENESLAHSFLSQTFEVAGEGKP